MLKDMPYLLPSISLLAVIYSSAFPASSHSNIRIQVSGDKKLFQDVARLVQRNKLIVGG